MKKTISGYIFFFVFAFSKSLLSETVNLKIVTDGQSTWASNLISELQRELEVLSDSRVSFRVVQDNIYHSEWDYNKASTNLKQIMQQDDTDIVVALGILSSDAIRKVKLIKPSIAANVVSPSHQGFPLTKEGSSGQRNLHYLMTNVDLVTEILLFKNATKAQKIGVLIDASSFNALPFLNQILKESEQQSGLELIPIQSSNVPNIERNLLSSTVDALVILPQLRFTKTQHQALINILRTRKIPSFSVLGSDEVEAGYLMGTALLPNYQQLARRLAIDIRDIVFGRTPESLLVSLDIKDRLTINMQTARDINYSPPFNILLEAVQINSLEETSEEITLLTAIDESLKHNLSIAIAETDYQLAQEDTKIFRSSLLPQLAASSSWQKQDEDLAVTRQTQTANIGVNLSQTLYSESQLSRFTSAKFLQKASKADYDAIKLDIIESTAQSYLEVIIAKTQFKIQQDNLQLTLANLARAEFRYKVGAANRSEKLRFETEVANDRQSVVLARSNYFQKIKILNQILHRPISKDFSTKSTDLKDPQIFGHAYLENLLDSPLQVKIFSDFLVVKSFEYSPEIISLEHQIKSQKRLLLAAKRKRFVPDVTLEAESTRIIDDNGTPFESDYDNDWNVGVNFTWTLYQGSKIKAEQLQAKITLQQLNFRLSQLKDNLETSTRNAVMQATASRINIELSKDSVDAAKSAYELVADSYTRGISSYIDLIDAQNSYLNAKLSSFNAYYTHLQDLMTVQRAIGFFDFYVSFEQSQQWFKQFEEFANQYKAKL
ncbi:MAG: TolC family protein [Pseudomonadota bacterium]